MSHASVMPAQETRLAVTGHTTAALAMPQQDFVELYCQPIEDDTWIRQEQIVKLENIVETEGSEAVKREILKGFAEERIRSGQPQGSDPILEGMLYQERFMQEYQHSERHSDAVTASSYRQQLVDSFRRKSQRPRQPLGATSGEEEYDLESKAVRAAVARAQATREPLSESEEKTSVVAECPTEQTEAPTEPVQQEEESMAGHCTQVSDPAPARGDEYSTGNPASVHAVTGVQDDFLREKDEPAPEVDYPADEAEAASAPEEEYPMESTAGDSYARAASGKTSPVAVSPKAAERDAPVSNCGEAAATNTDASADEM